MELYLGDAEAGAVVNIYTQKHGNRVYDQSLYLESQYVVGRLNAILE
jgi:hypothetical protein